MGLHARLFGMSDRKSVDDAVGEVAGWLTKQGVKFAISLSKTGLDVIEVVGRELMKGIKPEDSVLPTLTVYFSTHLYNIRVLEERQTPGQWLVTDTI